MTQFVLNETPRGRTRDGAKLVPVKVKRPAEAIDGIPPNRRRYEIGDTMVRNVNKAKIRYIKIRPTGPGHSKLRDVPAWIPLAQYVWQKVNGPIPPGMSLYHKNLRSLDDRLKNLVLGTVADRFAHYRATKPEKWKAHRQVMQAASTRKIRASAKGRRVLGFVPSMFYPVNHAKREILNTPCRWRWQAYVAAGVDEATIRANLTRNNDGVVGVALGWPGHTDSKAAVFLAMMGRGWMTIEDIWAAVRPIYEPRCGPIPRSMGSRYCLIGRMTAAGHLESRRNGKRVEWRLPQHIAASRQSWTDYVAMVGKQASRLVGYKRIDPVFGDVTEPTESVLWRVLRTVRAEAKASREKP
jgi:hypothetical protein